MPDPLCLKNHSAAHNENYIDHLMRAIAVSWLVEVACEYGFHQETLHTAASLLDRFLSASKVQSLPSQWQPPSFPGKELLFCYK